MFNKQQYNKKYRKEHKEQIKLYMKKYTYSKNKHCKCGELITNFSKKCNITANKNIDYWYAYFTYKIKE